MTNLEKILQRYYKYILILIFVVAIILRWWYLPNKNINFGYDQARDMFAVQQIVGGHLKILGPPTNSISNLFQGVLYYYVIAPPFLLGNGSPVVVGYWLALINALTIFPVFFITFLLTKKYIPATISALIFAFSFDAIQFSDFISNAGLGILFIPVIFLGLLLWIKKLSKFAPILTGLAFGFAVQSEIAFLFYLIPILIWLIVERNKINLKDVIIFVLSFVAAVSTMIISELKFGFPSTKGLIYLFFGKDAGIQGESLKFFITNFLNQTGNRFASTLYPFNHFFGSLLGFGMIIYSLIGIPVNKNKNNPPWQIFLVTYLFANLVALPFGGSNSPYIMIGLIPAIIIFGSVFLWIVFNQNKIFLFSVLTIILLINFSSFVKQNESSKPDYFTNDYLISTELKIIDYTYQKAEYKPFSISTLTMPIYVNTLWSYLYNWYGKEKYGYTPYWVGRDQIGLPGNNLINPPSGIREHFYIIEPTDVLPALLVTYSNGDQDSLSELKNEMDFGQMVVQERVIKSK